MTPLPIADVEIQAALSKAIEAKNTPIKNEDDNPRDICFRAFKRAQDHYAAGGRRGPNTIVFRFKIPSGNKRATAIEHAVRALIIDLNDFAETNDDVENKVHEFMADWNTKSQGSKYHEASISVGIRKGDEFIGKLTSPILIEMRRRVGIIKIKGVTLTTSITGSGFKADDYIKHLSHLGG